MSLTPSLSPSFCEFQPDFAVFFVVSIRPRIQNKVLELRRDWEGLKNFTVKGQKVHLVAWWPILDDAMMVHSAWCHVGP